LKKHFCPECGSRLATAYDSFVIDIDSPEAKEYWFLEGDKPRHGLVEMRTYHFECPDCGFTIPLDEMRALEKQAK
jgi:predicted RNA-binding Zn-ribbon protein involved in translation (DUF1610 family)